MGGLRRHVYGIAFLHYEGFQETENGQQPWCGTVRHLWFYVANILANCYHQPGYCRGERVLFIF